jgi:hypothetical protein
MLMRANNDYASIAGVRVFRNLHDGNPVLRMLMVGWLVMRMIADRFSVAMRDNPKDNGTASLVSMPGNVGKGSLRMVTLSMLMRGDGDIHGSAGAGMCGNWRDSVVGFMRMRGRRNGYGFGGIANSHVGVRVGGDGEDLSQFAITVRVATVVRMCGYRDGDHVITVRVRGNDYDSSAASVRMRLDCERIYTGCYFLRRVNPVSRNAAGIMRMNCNAAWS